MTRLDEHRRGLTVALAANLLWGFQPLYWPLVRPTPATEIVAHRALWTTVAMAGLLVAWRRWSWVRQTLRRPRDLAALGVVSLLLSASWGLYIFGVNIGRVVETSLGLFISPLATVVLGVVLLRERLRAAQWVAVGLAAVAVTLLTVDYGHLPWIALGLGGTFAAYALVKKRLAAPAVEGFALETALIVPLALAYVAWSFTLGDHTFGTIAPGHTALVVGSGLLTAIPLVAYASAVNRIPLVTVGVLMFLNPAIQFGIGVFVRGEQMTPVRWLGFALVWAALVLFITDSSHQGRVTATRGYREKTQVEARSS